MQCLDSDLFRDFPRLRFVIPQGGGAVRGIDPDTGHHFDDTRRYIDSAALDPAARRQIFEGNAPRIYPRLDRLLQAQGR